MVNFIEKMFIKDSTLQLEDKYVKDIKVLFMFQRL